MILRRRIVLEGIGGRMEHGYGGGSLDDWREYLSHRIPMQDVVECECGLCSRLRQRWNGEVEFPFASASVAQ